MKKICTHLIISTFLFLPLAVFAKDFGLENPIKVNSISELILIVTRVVRYIAIPFIVIAIMYSGYLFIWGSVNSKTPDVTKAKETIRYTIIGAFILLSSELIAIIMKNTIESLTK